MSIQEIIDIWISKTKISRFKTGILYGLEVDTSSYTNCDLNEFTNYFKVILERDGIDKKSVFFGLHEAYARAIGQKIKNIKIIVEFPASPIVLNEIENEFPDCKVIQVVRDPRANYISLKNHYINSNGNLVTFTKTGYNSAFIEILENLLSQYRCVEKSSKKNSDDWLDIRHEQLHAENERIVSQFSNWLGIKLNKSLYQSTIGGHPWKGNSSTEKPILGICPSIISRWRNQIQSNEKSIIEHYFRKEIRCYNYDNVSINKLSVLKSFLLPIKGEIGLKIKKSEPTIPILKKIWKYSRLAIFVIRALKSFDKILMAPFIYLKVRLWIVKNIKFY